MKKMKTNNNTKFIDFFIKKERNFLFNLNAEAFYHKDFKFYIGWFIYAIDDYTREEYDIKERFIYFFTNNLNLDIIFFIYIMSGDFRQRVINDIKEYKSQYGKEHIYD